MVSRKIVTKIKASSRNRSWYKIFETMWLGTWVKAKPVMSILSLFICLVNGGYSKWSLSVPCNVSCGKGMEIWRRTCDNPEPKYGVSNCNELGKSKELRKCYKKPCPGKIELATLVNFTIISLLDSFIISKLFFVGVQQGSFFLSNFCKGKPKLN